MTRIPFYFASGYYYVAVVETGVYFFFSVLHSTFSLGTGISWIVEALFFSSTRHLYAESSR